ncbi:PREDICTED: uncharacterized protein LOC105826389 [Propithecus coquereli]|uniref:uncharacterized protein LOC105826388 n=1 Tax=Propithecus coquereli TaxID=379532 RepID=UPI00063F6F13|nr:PREDICTED: uncharacterized protein LOC105826388 [Propithecus coquereli]XP_012519820.1 PREDICTED: uncharacterized protein LOC105826389 [Propithecus coquereli]
MFASKLSSPSCLQGIVPRHRCPLQLAASESSGLHCTGPKGCLLLTPVVCNDEPSEPLHDCLEIVGSLTNLRADLTDQPWPNPDEELYTDGSSYISEGVRYSGAAVVTADWVVWAQALSHGTSAQKAELTALTQTLRWGKDRTVTIYTDSRYAFAMAHVHGVLYQERGLLTSKGKEIKNKLEILALLEAIWLPKNVAIIHCKGHQTANSPIAKGNAFADVMAKEVAQKPVGPLQILPVLSEWLLLHSPTYTNG